MIARVILLSLLLLATRANASIAEARALDLRLAPTTILGSAGDGPAEMEARLVKVQLACAGGTALVAMPIALLAGSLAGMLTNDLVSSALPAVLVYLLLPPGAASFAAWTVGNRSAAVSPGFWGAFGLGVAAHLVLTVGAVLVFGVSSRGMLGATLFSIVDAAVLMPVIVYSMDGLADVKQASPPSTPVTPPAAPETPAPAQSRAVFSLPIVAGSF